MANFSGALATRSAGGRWSRTVLPGSGRASLVGQPAGGFVVCWTESGDNTLTYATADLDASGSMGPRTSLATVTPPVLDPMFDLSYDPRPKLAAGAGGAMAVAWHAGTSVSFARKTGGAWQPLQTMPASGGGPERLGYTRPFDLALDRSGTLLAAWQAGEGLLSAQWAPGQSWSPTTLLASAGSDIQLAMNANGVAFAAWRDGEGLMAARSPHR